MHHPYKKSIESGYNIHLGELLPAISSFPASLSEKQIHLKLSLNFFFYKTEIFSNVDYFFNFKIKQHNYKCFFSILMSQSEDIFVSVFP